MSGPVQIAVVAGLVLLLVHVSLRQFGSRDVRVNIKALRESWDGRSN